MQAYNQQQPSQNGSDGFETMKLSPLETTEIVAALQNPSIADRISLQPLTSTVSKQDLRNCFPEGPIIACDFHVTGIEQDSALASGFHCEKTDIINIDHHAPAERMFRFVSSGTLAIEHVLHHGIAPDGTHIIVNHTDCDSVISSLIVAGFLPPHPHFNAAVIAADHTGAANPISDLLQALDSRRNIAFSARNLGLLLDGAPLEPSAQQLLDKRISGREETRVAIEQGDALLEKGNLTVVRNTGNMRNEFMPALLPDAMMILTCEPGKTDDTWVARFRLGNAAPPGLSILDLNLGDFDPAYGGRWNAGSNKRGGGTAMPLTEYIRRTHENLQAALARQIS
jgi:hypothetical protein